MTHRTAAPRFEYERQRLLAVERTFCEAATCSWRLRARLSALVITRRTAATRLQYLRMRLLAMERIFCEAAP